MAWRIPVQVLAVVVIAGLALAGPAPARSVTLERPSVLGEGQPPRAVEMTVWFQGFLADATSGEPVNATYDIVASIYSTAGGGTPLWGPETHGSVTITEGWFNIELGSVIGGLPDFDNPPYYLDLTVNAETLDPRLKLASVPSAFRAAGADAPDEDWSFSGGDIYRPTGEVGIGTANPNAHLDVAGTIETDGFRLTGPSAEGWVLTTDGSGNAIWAPLGYAGFLPFAGSYGEDDDAFHLTHTYPGWDAAVFDVTHPTSSGNAIEANAAGYGATMEVYQTNETTGGGNAGLFAVTSPGNPEAAVYATTQGGGPSYYGGTAGVRVAEFRANGEGESDVVYAAYQGTGPYDAVAVHGICAPQDYYGVGASFQGGWKGCEGYVNPTGSGTYYGFYGHASGGSGTNYGIYASASGGATNWAGYFSGNTHVSGTLSKTAGSFKIDHPLDPENKYLYHSFIESPDMKNVYDGVASLDASGEAWIELPEWFEALNSDFRYQLTCIGSYAPVYVAEEISRNRFRIAGGETGMKVSWQVTGIRQDRYAQDYRIPVEEDKPLSERGKYLHPELYGASERQSVSHDPKLAEYERRAREDEAQRELQERRAGDEAAE
jgi:hypothetical protein